MASGLMTRVVREQLDDLLAHPGQIRAEVPQQLRGDALALADQAEQQMLGADVVVPERQRLTKRELESLLRPRREGRRVARGRAGRTDRPAHLFAHRLERDAE